MARLIPLLGLFSLALLLAGHSGHVAGQAEGASAPDYFLTKVFVMNDPTPIGSQFGRPQGLPKVIANGDVLFGAALVDGRTGVFKYSRGQTTKVVASGDLGPDGEPLEGVAFVDANDAGEVLFNSSGQVPGSFYYYMVSEAGIRAVTHGLTWCIELNDAGQVLCTDQKTIYVVSESGTRRVVGVGDPFPDIPEFVVIHDELVLGPLTIGCLGDAALDDLGRVTFVVGGTWGYYSCPGENGRIYQESGGGLSLVAGACSPIGEGLWTYALHPRVNDLGQVIFDGAILSGEIILPARDPDSNLLVWDSNSNWFDTHPYSAVCPPGPDGHTQDPSLGWSAQWSYRLYGSSLTNGAFRSSGSPIAPPVSQPSDSCCASYVAVQALNNRGKALVRSYGGSLAEGLFVTTEASTKTVVKRGDPGPSGAFDCALIPFADSLNDAGEVAFRAYTAPCNNATEGIFLASPVKVQPTDVCFLNDHKITFDQLVQQPDGPPGGYTDNGGGLCEWSQLDSGGIRNLPVAYIRARNVNLQAKFSIEPPLDEPADAEVTGVGPDGMVFRWNGSVVGDTLDTGTMIASEDLPNTVGVYDQMTIQWFVEIDGAGISAEQSKHTLYRTLGPDPPPPGENYLTLLDIGSRFAAGMTEADAAAAGVWNGFKTRRPALNSLCPNATGLMPGVFAAVVGDDGRVARTRLLRYYGCYDPAADPLQQNAQPCVLGVLAALRNRIGNCYSWAQMLSTALAIQDLAKRATVVKITSALGDDDGFIVNNWNFIDRLIPIGRHPYTVGDTAIDLPGIPGQGNPNPPSQFKAHWIVCYQASVGSVYLDPSYGFGADPAAYENSAIAGFYSDQRNLAGALTSRHARKQDPQVQELDFLYWSGTVNPGCESLAPERPPEHQSETSHFHVAEHETIEIPVVVHPLPASPVNLFAHLGWSGSDVEMSLISPSGRIIDRTTSAEDTVHDGGTTFEVYEVANAERGQWTVRLFGADIPVGGEDVTLLVSVTARRSADNSPPATAASLNPSPNPAGWNNTNVDVNLTANDEGSGVKEVHYRVDAGAEMVAPGDAAAVLVTNEGVHTVSFWAVDNADNAEEPHALEVRVDKSPPLLNTGLSSGIYFASSLAALAVPCSASDAPSGLDGPVVVALNGAPAVCPTSITQAGTYSLSMSATDLAGNGAAASATYTVYPATVLAPLFDGVLNTFRLGRTLPVKIAITDGNGAAVTTLNPTLWLLPGDWTPESETIAVPVQDSGQSGDSGNTMRYSSTCTCYIFNLSTQTGFTAGQRYTLVAMAEGHIVATLLLQGN